ncbi:MAG: adenine-specific methyltransferase EcoRI family protein [Mycoplasma sp.]
MNKTYNKAKSTKNDEFYTFSKDIESEIKYYENYFKDQIVYCNCDHPEKSNFSLFFKSNFDKLKLKKLIITHYNNPTLTIITKTTNTTTKIEDGSFNSPQCLELLKESNIIIITNPPFSLFRDFITTIINYRKKFLIVGPDSIIGYKELFPLFQSGEFHKGKTRIKSFFTKDNEIKKFGNIGWYTNLQSNILEEFLPLTKKYNSIDYPKYNNYDAINVDKLKDIPKDYYEPIGVPMTFFDVYNPKQFKIIKFRKGNDNKDLNINNKSLYNRVIIKRIKN